MKTIRNLALIFGAALLCFFASITHLPAAQPKLTISPAYNGICLLSWNGPANGFVLEETDSLSPPLWHGSPEIPELVDNEFIVSVSVSNTASRFFRLHLVLTNGLPPDPESVAPLPADGTATILGDATAFLYTGDNPIQTGVAPGTIEFKRAAVLRGKLKTRSGAPLPGVTVTILDHPELGSTLSRTDGAFDLAANGGGPLTVNFEKTGFCPVQRQIQVPWQDYVIVPEVVMIEMDSLVTPITLGTNSPFQAAQGSLQSDAAGARRATLLFSAGTCANLILANGSTQSCGSLNVRATEFTVGPNGPASMPAVLPPASGYTYCVELSADEAVAASAPMVAFDRPVHFYLENFIGFPVGMSVPTGYYDRQKAAWVPSINGRVIQVLDVNGGSASVDTDGDGQADNDLGLSADEQSRLANLYAAGQTLWRVPITHFTPWDCNWPFGPPDDAITPAEGGAEVTSSEDPLEDAAQCEGCVIEAENQVLGEALTIVGTPYTLNYRSDRVPGRIDAMNITLSGPIVPASLSSIRLRFSGAGQIVDQTFPPAPSQKTVFVWNGLDAYGRPLLGGQVIRGTIDYEYPAVFKEPDEFTASFARFGDDALVATESRSRIGISMPFTARIREGLSDARVLGLGGWTLNLHHFYDPRSGVLHTGDGQRRRAESLPRIIDSVLSNLVDPSGLAIAPDGTVYVSEQGVSPKVRRIAPDGTVTIFAGGGTSLEDGVPATTALIAPFALALGPDGNLYMANRDFDPRIRRVSPGGTITTVAGTGTPGFSGDGGPATQAELNFPSGIAVAPDGTLYIADQGNQRIRQVTPDGVINTIAGNGTDGFGGDDGPAVEAMFSFPFGLAIGPDGALFVADEGNHRIRRIGPDGIITTVAGNGVQTFAGDGGPAVAASLNDPFDVKFGPDGTLYIADLLNLRVRAVRPDGIILTIAGNGEFGFSGDGGPATAARLGRHRGVAVAPDGTLYIAATDNARVRRVRRAVPGFTGEQITIASADGGELYFFDAFGRHARTVHALTGATLLEFGYDTSGRLDRIIRKTGGIDAVTVIQHDGNGQPTAIVGPLGQITRFGVDANGFLSRVVNPALETNQMAYTASGLLTNKTDPRGHQYSFFYDPQGRLLREEDPGGGSQTFVRTLSETNSLVTRTRQLGRVTTFETATLTNGVQRRTATAPDAAKTQLEQNIERGTTRMVTPDGTTKDTVLGPDPRFGMEAAFPAGVSLRLPSALQANFTNFHTAVLSNAVDPLSLRTLTESNVVNGRGFTTTYSAGSNTFTFKTPEGRQTLTTIDSLGRVVRAQRAGLDAVEYGYDELGRLASIVHGTGAVSRTITIGYNAAGFMDTITDPFARTLSMDYDNAGRLIQATRPDNSVAEYGHDALGNLTSITPPGRPAHTLSYDAMNRLTNYIPPNVGPGSGSIQFRYDIDGRLTSIGLSGGAEVSVNRDPGSGRLTSVVLPTGTFTYNHDAAGNVTNITSPGGLRLSYRYDGSLLTQMAWVGQISGSVARTHDNNLRIASELVNGGSLINYQYDRDGLLTNVGGLAVFRHPQHGMKTGTALGIVSDSSGYDGFAEITNYVARINGTEVFNATYDHDRVGRIIRKSETILGTTTVFEYGFDLAGRLTNVVENSTAAASYTYDPAGNRLSRATPQGSVTGIYDDQNRLLQYGGATYTYDEIGQVSGKTAGGHVTTYTYDKLGNLLGATLPNGTQLEYIIDGRNRRVGKRVNGALVQGFLYRDALRPSAELDASSQVTSRFVYHARFLSHVIKGGSTFRILTDYIGSPRLVIDVTSGAIVQRMDYDEFGNVVLDTNPGFQPFGFAGGLYDRDTGLVRFGARDYDAETGRWTAREPHGPLQVEDIYTYVANDPVNSVDPFGLQPDDLDDPTIEQPVWDELQESLQRAEERMQRIRDRIEGLRPGSPRWNELRKMRENVQQLITDLRRRMNNNQINAGGVVGKLLCVAGGLDFAFMAIAAVENGHSFLEELDIQAEAEQAENAENGVHTTLSCLGPFCIVSELDENGKPMQYDPVTGKYYPSEL